jgi:hypothetical protein
MEVKRVFILLKTNENFSLRRPAEMIPERAGGFTPPGCGSADLFWQAVLSRSRLTFRRLPIRLNITCSCFRTRQGKV